IAAINALYILLFFFPIGFSGRSKWDNFTQGLFIAINALAFAFELCDWSYFPFNQKRATADVINMVSRKGDFLSLLPNFFIDYWYVPVAWIAFLVVIIITNKKIRKHTHFTAPNKTTKTQFAIRLVGLLVIGGLTVVGERGGLQYVPIGVRNAVG